MPFAWSPDGPDVIAHGDNLDLLPLLPDGSMRLAYLDPPFNTGRVRERVRERAAPAGAGPNRQSSPVPGTRVEALRAAATFDDRFADYWAFLEPRLLETYRVLHASGTLYLHLDYREAHYAKVLLDGLFGRENFLNEIVWAYDYGARTRRRWPTKHDTILVYVKDRGRYHFDAAAVDREPYMAPGLVTPEKAARGKLPTDVWWHTIVSPTGAEKTGYPTQKPLGVLRRIVAASSEPGDWVLDPFAGSGTTGAAARALGRRSLLIDANPDAVALIRQRLAACPSP